MESNVIPTRYEPPGFFARWLMRFIALSGAGISAYLLYHAVYGSQVLGCGAGSGCDAVLKSAWSRVAGIPVAAPGLVTYGAMLGALLHIGPQRSQRRQRGAWMCLMVLSGIAALAAMWFMAVQWLFLQSFCAYCITLHAHSLALAMLVFRYAPIGARRVLPDDPPDPMMVGRWAAMGLVALGAVGVSALAATQWNFPTPLRGYEVIFLVPDGDGFMQEKLSRNEYPVLGAPTAEFVAVYLYDYTCPHCRKMHAQMEEALARYGEEQLAVMLAPAPLNTDCNPHVAETEEGKQEACKLARLALQVWVADREKFAAFDGWLFEPSEPRTAVEARAQAQQLVGAAALNAAGAQAEQMLQSGVALYGRAGGGQLPKLFLRQEIVVGVPETAAKLFEMLEDKLGLQAR